MRAIFPTSARASTRSNHAHGESVLLFPREDAARVRSLADAFNCPPAFVADAFGVSPERIERLLVSRGQYNPEADIALIDAIRKLYGESAANLCLED